MNAFKRFKFTLLIFSFILPGCYTQFSTLDSNSTNYEQASANSQIDSTVTRIDTIVQNSREICVWERDLTGYPRLRCYPSTYFSREWYLYNQTPWWFRNDPLWSDYRRCPRMYYYDPNCGCCKYGRPPIHIPSNPTPQPPSNNTNKPPSRTSRSHGVPLGPTVSPVQSGTSSSPEVKQTQPSTSSSTPSTSTQTPVSQPQNQPTTQQNGNQSNGTTIDKGSNTLETPNNSPSPRDSVPVQPRKRQGVRSW